MVVSHEHKFVYYAPPKTGTTSTEDILENRFGSVLVGNTPNRSLRHQVYYLEELKDYFAFVSVRNPFSRLISAYNYSSRPDESLHDWMQGITPDPIAESLFFNGRSLRIDAIIRMESLQEDFNRLPFVKEKVVLPFLNMVKKSKIRSLPRVAMNFVRKRYYYDFKIFGYDPSDKSFESESIKMI